MGSKKIIVAYSNRTILSSGRRVNDELWKRRVVLLFKLVIGYNQLGHEHNMGILNMLRLYG